ncbi:hypothetical protein EJ03DRAFT_353457 [Teratosphaeria nubilosa]|uniref:Uncharacterized protein n=1 Tax=Teratosphaeria nubilosa TaxID=161662 RepID=A0A6G1L3M7_9PEZI|nr:hypothetical protein EJ03DRAFT_353457 [Teratosphaeria nubilosa]
MADVHIDPLRLPGSLKKALRQKDPGEIRRILRAWDNILYDGATSPNVLLHVLSSTYNTNIGSGARGSSGSATQASYHEISEDTAKLPPRESLKLVSLTAADGRTFNIDTVVDEIWDFTHSSRLREFCKPQTEKIEKGAGPGALDLVSHLHQRMAILVMPSRYLGDVVASNMPRNYRDDDKMYFRIMTEIKAVREASAAESKPSSALKRLCTHVVTAYRRIVEKGRIVTPYGSRVYAAATEAAIILSLPESIATLVSSRLFKLGESIEQLLDAINERGFATMRPFADALLNKDHGDGCYQALLRIVTMHEIEIERDRRAIERQACKRMKYLTASEATETIDWLSTAARREAAEDLAARPLPIGTPKEDLYESVIAFGHALLNGLKILPMKKSVAVSAFRRVVEKKIKEY